MAAYPLYALVYESASPVPMWLSPTAPMALHDPHVWFVGLHHSLQDLERVVREELFRKRAKYPDVHFNSAETINLDEYRRDNIPKELLLFKVNSQLRHVASYSLNTFAYLEEYFILSIYLLEMSISDDHIRAGWLDDDEDDDEDEDEDEDADADADVDADET